MATMLIPTPLRKFTNNTAKVSITSGKVSDAITELTEHYPQLKRHLIDVNGKLNGFINIFVNSDDVRSLDQGQTRIEHDTVISIVPAIAGGIHYPVKESL